MIYNLKTTLLRYIALKFAKDEQKDKLQFKNAPLLPVFIPLRDFGRYLKNPQKDYVTHSHKYLRDFIEKYFESKEFNLPENFFSENLKRDRFIILFDGLDEVGEFSDRVKVAENINAFIEHYKNNRFIISSRPKGFEDVKMLYFTIFAYRLVVI